jgi:general secretion pathway protein F/type IV pilus assembly protein PilC
MFYRYSGISKKSYKKVKGVIQASSIEEAKSRLKADSILFDSIKESKKESIFSGIEFLRKDKFTNLELASLSKNLAIYLDSGVTLVNAIKLLKTLYEDEKKIKNFLSSIEVMIEEGSSFYNALEKQNSITLPNFYKQSIKVSEDGGILSEILVELASYIKSQDDIKKQIQKAFTYPLFIISVSVLMVSFMLTVVVPKITSIFDSLNQELPPITTFVISSGEFFGAYWMHMLFLVILAVLIHSFFYRVNKSYKYSFDFFVLKIPFFGDIAKTSELARFAYISSMLLKSGVNFVHTIKLSAEILNSSVLKKVFEDASIKVVEGDKLSKSLMKDVKYLDKSFIQAIALAEETSQVSEIMNNLSNLYFEQNRDKIDKFLAILEPMIMLIVGGVIGAIVIAMLLPIFSMNLSGGF